MQGESPCYIMFVQILPNASGPLIVDAMLRVGYAIFAIGTLGFLGLGLPPPSPDWGSMVNLARRFVWTNPSAVALSVARHRLAGRSDSTSWPTACRSR